ncbi:conjugal transfer protein [Streptomyces sp. NPDC006476]|uniref:conjugal transfer protein n=1 Tax=Streptomyces sp. NPDC006476 TaxID=3157175 RepID=UPI0033B7188C
MSPGKRASQSEAAAPVAAGVALEAMRRRVRLSRLAVWAVIAAGPVALAVTVASTPTTVEAAPSDKPTAARTEVAPVDPGGYAQLFVSAWLRSSADEATSAQARLAQSMAPGVELPQPTADAPPAPRSVSVLRTAQRAGGAWSVTVAAQYADGSIRYYVVPVVANGTGTSFAVTGAPGVVAGPVRAAVPKSRYDVTVAEGDLPSAVGEFLAVYLTGAGDVDRYLAPGVKLAPVSPAPYSAISVQQVSAVEETAAAARVPADGTQVHVLALVEARDAVGRWPLAYELTLTARSGRWDIAALDSGAAQGGDAR